MSKKVFIKNKVALVTGANRGIGKAIAIELLEKGAQVVAAARQLDSLAELQSRYKENLTIVQLDVTDQESVQKAATSIASVDILINNAGIINFGNFLNGNALHTLNDCLNVNVTGLIRVTGAFINDLSKKESGAVVNISSMAGLGNMPMMLTYSASKAAVHSITQGLRGELKETGVLVCGVYPGPIDTEMTQVFEIEKDSPENVARAIVQGIENGTEDIFPDAMSRQMGPLFYESPKQLEIQFSNF